ncbi:CCCH domain-containing protein [Cryptosporidium canis]|nr:CCCH domain-containing protein [Cryptosporidium canis]
MGEQPNTELTEEERAEYVSRCIKNSEAPIKLSYLRGGRVSSRFRAESEMYDDEERPKEDQDETLHSKKRSSRGTFKANERSKNLSCISGLDRVDRLCPNVAVFGECNLDRDSCKKNHDLEGFLKSRREEAELMARDGGEEGRLAPESCPIYKSYGICHLGLNCEFGLDHFSESCMSNVNSKGERVTKEMVENFHKSYEKNVIDSQLRTELRQKTLKFPKTQDFLDNFLPTKRRGVRGCEKNGQAWENPLLALRIPCTTERSFADSEFRRGSPFDEELKLSSRDCVGISRYERERRKHSFFKDKLILAPLTTVGNMPFRRLCLRFGADITVSEMVLSNEILSGKGSELALLKRSPEEKHFGIQLAGGNKSTIIKAGEFINEHCEFDFIDINAACPLKSLHDKGAGSILLDRAVELETMVQGLKAVTDNKLVTVKVRMSHGGSPINKSLFEKTYLESFENWPIIYNNMRTHKILGVLCDSGIDALTIHGRTAFQRYTKEADWSYIRYCSFLNSKLYSRRIADRPNNCLDSIPMCPSIIGCGDIICYQDYQRHMENDSVDSVMIGRGALLKPWIFTEIRESRNWDISASERLDIIKQYVNLGLEHWGTDKRGIGLTRRFLLEFLSFFHRYIPIGILEQPIHTQSFNWRAPKYIGRNDLETLLASSNSADWIKISEMFLGKVPEDFVFIPKHKANSSQ